MTEVDANVVPDYRGMLRFDGKVVVVLGAGQGIGLQTSNAFAQLGATVVCVDREADRAEAVAKDVAGVPWNGDITSRDDVQRLFDFVAETQGRLDAVVDIVGLSRYKDLTQLTDEDWLWHHEINIRHAYLALTYAAKYWEKTGTAGSVTFVASVAGMDSSPNLAAYGANKAAMMSLVRSAAVELGPLGVRVNSVAPGIVRTPRQQDNPKWTQELLDSNKAKTPLRKLAYPSDIAAGIVFLASDLAVHVTGHALTVDGGNNIVFNVDSPTP